MEFEDQLDKVRRQLKLEEEARTYLDKQHEASRKLMQDKEDKVREELSTCRQELLAKEEVLDGIKIDYEKQLAAHRIRRANVVEFMRSVQRELGNLRKWSGNFDSTFLSGMGEKEKSEENVKLLLGYVDHLKHVMDVVEKRIAQQEAYLSDEALRGARTERAGGGVGEGGGADALVQQKPHQQLHTIC